MDAGSRLKVPLSFLETPEYANYMVRELIPRNHPKWFACSIPIDGFGEPPKPGDRNGIITFACGTLDF